MEFPCSQGPKKYTTKRRLSDHLFKKHKIDSRKTANYTCAICSKKFIRCDNVFRHLREKHNAKSPKKCSFCDEVCKNLAELQQRASQIHEIRTSTPNQQSKLKFTTKQHASNKFFQSFRMRITDELDLHCLMQSCKDDIQKFLQTKVMELGPIKLQFSVFVNLLMPIDETKVSCLASSDAKPVITQMDDNDYYSMIDQMVSTIQIFCSSGSGFIVPSLAHLDINFNLFKPNKGSSFIPTPEVFRNKSFLLNIHNRDQICFAYAVLAALYPCSSHTKNEAASYRSKLDKLKMTGFEFPMPIKDIPRFESINNLGINVFGVEKKQITPLYLSKTTLERINLLLLSDGVRFYYALITKFKGFMARQFERSTNRTKFCERFLHGFSSQQILSDHLILCGQHEATAIKMPPEGSTIRFQHWLKTSICPFVIYADTEALCLSAGKNLKTTDNTTKLEEQTPCSFGALLVDRTSKKSFYDTSRGENAISSFFNLSSSES